MDAGLKDQELEIAEIEKKVLDLVLDWLKALKTQDRQAYAKCVARIRLLTQFGYELRRPLADYLEQGIYELRIRKGRVN